MSYRAPETPDVLFPFTAAHWPPLPLETIDRKPLTFRNARYSPRVGCSESHSSAPVAPFSRKYTAKDQNT